MIPLKDNIPMRRFPVISVLLIAANVIVFLVDQSTGSLETVHAVLADGRLVRIHHFVGGITSQYALIPADVTTNLAAHWQTVFASMFLHSNWLHIGGNMLSLWIFGNNVEDTLGKPRFILFYLACGVAAAAAQIMSNPGSEIPMVGASGAVAGLMGAYLILFPHAEILAIVPVFFFGWITEVPAILVIGFWVVLQFINASWLGGGGMLRGGGIAYFAHIGGLVAGILLILLLGGRRLVEQRDARPRRDEDYQA